MVGSVAYQLSIENIQDDAVEEDNEAKEFELGGDRSDPERQVRDERVIGSVNECSDEYPFDNDGAGALLVELRQPKIVARECRVDDLARPRERPRSRGRDPCIEGRHPCDLGCLEHFPSDVERILDRGEPKAGYRATHPH